MDFLEYSDIACEVRGDMTPGKLKLTDERLIWRGSRGAKKEEVLAAGDLDLVNWQRLAGSWGLRIFTKDGSLHRFAGFKEAEREKLAKYFKSSYKMDMLDRELSVKGWNYGTANFNGSVLGFEVGKADAFEVPLPYVNQCISGKNEVTLEFHSNDDAAVMLTEMRFHIPSSELAGDDPVESFKENVMKKASVVTTSGDAIAIFREIHCLSPRGRYDIKVFPSYVQMHGKTFDYKISTSSVMRLFLLPHKDQRQMYLVVNVDPPVKQGQTRYHYLVFNFKQEDEEEVELPFEEDELKEKFDGKLQKEMSGPTYEVISTILKALTGKKVTHPGNFLGHSGTPAISCSHKAASGFIYPLERAFIFVYKPPIYLRYDEVRSVEFERSGGSTRSFDINVALGNDIAYTFSSIEKGEYARLYEFLKSKGIKLRTGGVGASKSGLNWEDQKVDHHLAKVQNEAMEMLGSGDESMSSDDSDFNPDNLEALSAKEEYDSEPSTTSSEEDSSDGTESGEEARKRREDRKKRREEKRERRAKAAERREQRKEKGETKKKVKVKLPGQPKRNMSAYFIWMNENRDKIKAANPEMSMTEIGKKAGELWKAMSDKSEWEKRAADDKKRYDEEMAKWLESGGKEALAAAKKAAKKEKRMAKAGTSGTSGGGAAKSKSKAEKKAGPAVDPKGGSGGGFKSKEFIEDSDSSSDGGGGGKGKAKPGTSGKGKRPTASADKEDDSSSDEVQKSPGPSGSGSASGGSDSD